MLTSLQIGRGGLGRMGNQMFTIAGVIGIAIKSRQPYGFPRWVNYDNAIFGAPVDDIENYLVNELPRSDGLSFQEYGYFWGYRDINLPTGSWSIDAHMQSDKFTKHCMGTIREVFRFKDEPEQNDYVAIHYRGGDYIDDAAAQHPRCSKEYYEKAMALFPGEKFILFSDDPMVWLNMMGVDGITYHDGNTYIEDFKLMKRCKSFICANSSFSSMAALLGEHPEKKIVQPNIWFGTQMPPEWVTDDVYHENSIVI